MRVCDEDVSVGDPCPVKDKREGSSFSEGRTLEGLDPRSGKNLKDLRNLDGLGVGSPAAKVSAWEQVADSVNVVPDTVEEDDQGGAQGVGVEPCEREI